MKIKCFHCGKYFERQKADCTVCSWQICPYCYSCFCHLSPEGQRVARAMQEQYVMRMLKLRGETTIDHLTDYFKLDFNMPDNEAKETAEEVMTIITDHKGEAEMSGVVGKYRMSSCPICDNPIVEGEGYKFENGIYYHEKCDPLQKEKKQQSDTLATCYNCGSKFKQTPQSIIADVVGKKDAPFCGWSCLYETMKEGT